MRSSYRLVVFLVMAVMLQQQQVVVQAEDAATSEDTTATEEPKIVASIPVRGGGQDKDEHCAEWAQAGECQNNPDFMKENCAASCGSSSRRAYVLDGEDAAIGAFRFVEDYNIYETNNNQDHTISLVLQVAKELQQALEGETYTPPEDVTHCTSGNKKARLCSAGKLWKRAEELRKAGDMYDAAGADYIRALLREGLEVDFAEQCQRSLLWAFSSITKQREREARERLEEEKIELRRQEERAAMDEAMERKKEYEADWIKFSQRVMEDEKKSDTKTEATVGADGTVDEESNNSHELVSQVIQSFLLVSDPNNSAANWKGTLNLIKKIPPSDKTTDTLLIEARCHEMLGNYKLALSAAGRLIQKAASYDPWINDSPRMMAVTLGANAAMQLGLSDNAISFYQTVLKFDPEQERTRKQYRGLKKVVKLMNKAEEQIQKGYNKAASEFVDQCLSAMRGLDVDSPLFRSKIQLKQCTILSGMGQHEEALANCDTAVELRVGNDSVSRASQKESLLARAEALMLDDDYDEAVTDFRMAFDMMDDDDEQKREVHHKLQNAMQQQSLWNGGEKDHRFNEHTGYPDGRPPQRDHAKLLQLPIDLEQRSKDIKCRWLKKQFKLLVKTYHPDKYKGNKKRAARKFKEVKEAKDIISKQWGC
mmetsp:Transcript_25944/g.39263  ORF Transcript_25944/g.39263 Transcript_25944/m.39263 type:complete len:651 (-) Transcript_25944:208-2160(-)